MPNFMQKHHNKCEDDMTIIVKSPQYDYRGLSISRYTIISIYCPSLVIRTCPLSTGLLQHGTMIRFCPCLPSQSSWNWHNPGEGLLILICFIGRLSYMLVLCLACSSLVTGDKHHHLPGWRQLLNQ